MASVTTRMLTRIFLLVVIWADWAFSADAFRPTFVSEAAVPNRRSVMPFLKAVCPDWIRTQQEKNREVFGCGIALNEIVPRSRTRRYSWNESMQWRADGIIFGHFL